MDFLLALVLVQERGVSPEEAEKRKESLYKLAEEAARKRPTWKGKQTFAESDDWILQTGEIWKKDRKLYLQRPGHRALCEDGTLDRADDEEKLIRRYDLTETFVAESILRDGFTRELEARFVVEIVIDARFQVLVPTKEHMKEFGDFETWEDYMKWLEKQEKEGHKEIDPHKDKRQAFEKDPPKSDGKSEIIYVVKLKPRGKGVPEVALWLRYDLLPIRLTIDGVHDETWTIADLVTDEPIEDARFKLDASGYTIQKEK